MECHVDGRGKPLLGASQFAAREISARIEKVGLRERSMTREVAGWEERNKLARLRQRAVQDDL